MSRRKQPRPRHVENEELGLSVGDHEQRFKDFKLAKGDNEDKEDEAIDSLGRRSGSDNDNSDDDKHHGAENNDEVCSSSEASSPVGCSNIRTCDKCGVFITDDIAHKMRCSSRIRMPYDPPVHDYFRNGYEFCRSRFDNSVGNAFSDNEDFESIGEEDTNFETDDEGRKRKRRRTSEAGDNSEDNVKYECRLRSHDSFVDGFESLTEKLLNDTKIKHVNYRDNFIKKFRTKEEERGEIEEERNDDYKEVEERAGNGFVDDNEKLDLSFLKNGKDPAIAWAMKAAERGLFDCVGSMSFSPIAAVKAAVEKCGDGQGSAGHVPEEVNMFRTMLIQLQQQQMMQIQMMQRMKRQLVSSGVNPDMLPVNFDLDRINNEGLTSLGTATSGLQNGRLSAEAAGRDGKLASFGGSRGTLECHSQIIPSRNSSPSQSEMSRKSDNQSSSPISGKSFKDRLMEDTNSMKDEKPISIKDITETQLSPNNPKCESSYSTEPAQSFIGLTKNPLEILQDRTSTTIQSLTIPQRPRSSSSSLSRAPSSSLLNCSALFASSPSLSALQKETDALKPSPILPPMSYPMTAEDYKGYIQRGTMLERSQYASDDPFFKHKCRFCHKVFGSDSALQIHVRSHTGERPFKCNICGNRFSTKGNLKVHFERHKAKYPHIKMDATPVPEHLDRQHNLIFPPRSISPSGTLSPQTPRLPIPSAAQEQPSSPSPITSHRLLPSPTSFPAVFGGSFLPPLGACLPPFTLMPPPRESMMPFPHPFRVYLPPNMVTPPHPGTDSNLRRDFKISNTCVETSVIKSLHKDSPADSSSTTTESDALIRSSRHQTYQHPLLHLDHITKHESKTPDEYKNEDSSSSQDEIKKKEIETEKQRPESHADSKNSRNLSPIGNKIFIPTSLTSKLSPQQPYPAPCPSSCPSSTNTSLQSVDPVITWASLSSPQPILLPGHHTSFFPPHHLPPGFSGLGHPLYGMSTSFPIPSHLNPILSMSGPRSTAHFLPSHRPQNSPLSDEDPTFQNYTAPTKTIDPSENLEQYMEVHKSETSKLEALVKNIERKITDPNQCVICHRILSCKSALQMHYRIHTGERPFKCKICGRSFTTKGNLKTHMGVHRVKPALRMMHQCPVCHKQFTNILVLQQHIRAHTGSLPHLPLSSSHVQWPHRPQFVLNRSNPFIPRLHPNPQSFDLSRRTFFNPSRFSRARLMYNKLHHDFPSSTTEIETLQEDNPATPETDWKQGEEAFTSGDSPRTHSTRHLDNGGDTPRTHSRHLDNGGDSPRTHSRHLDNGGDSPRTHSRHLDNGGDSPRTHSRHLDNGGDTPRTHSTRHLDNVETMKTSPAVIPLGPRTDEILHDSFPHSGRQFESSVLPPAFGDLPFDTPLAALEERVKAIDSHLSQTSFEKFRMSMGLGSTMSPTSPCLSSGEKVSDCGSDLGDKTDSPASVEEDTMISHSKRMFDAFHRDSFTSKICMKTFDTTTVLDLHGRGLAQIYSIKCHVCNQRFDNECTLQRHLLSHKTDCVQSSGCSDSNNCSAKNCSDELPDTNNADNDNDSQRADEDYPLEEGSSEEEDLDMSPVDLGHITDEFTESPTSERSRVPRKYPGVSQEHNNNSSNFHNHNGDELEDTSSQNLSVAGNSLQKSFTSTVNSQSTAINFKPQQPTRDYHQFQPPPSRTSETSISPHSPVHSHPFGEPETPYSCSSNAPSLTHTQSSEPKHQCKTCMKPFSSASALQIHTRTHTGDKPFKCTMCTKAFTTRGNLKVHMGTHMWNNSPSRRGRRMSIEAPFLLPQTKDSPIMLSTFHPRRPSAEFFYKYPLSIMEGTCPKFSDVPIIHKFGETSPLQSIPRHHMHNDIPKDDHISKTNSSASREAWNLLDTKPSPKELDLTSKLPSVREPSPSRSVSSTPPSPQSPSLLTLPLTASTSSNTPSPINCKDRISTAAVGLRNIHVAPWMWGAFPCLQCETVLPSQNSLEHHLRVLHLLKVESPAHTISKTEPHPPKALLA